MHCQWIELPGVGAPKAESYDAERAELAAARRELSPGIPATRTFGPGSLGASWVSTGAFPVDDDLRVLFGWDGEVAFLAHLGSPDEVN